MAFGVTADGFQAKRVEDIKKELEESFRTVFGSGINLNPRGPFGQIIGILSEREGEIWELTEDVYNGFFPQNAQGVGVDNALSLVGLTRKASTNSIATLRFFGTAGTVIPIDTQVSRSDDSTVVFDTEDNTGTILAGTGTDEVQDIAFSAVPDSGSFTLDFGGQITAAILFSDSAAAVEAALEALSNIGVGNVAVTGSYAAGFTVTFQAVLGEAPQVLLIVNSNTLLIGATPVTVTPSETTPGVLPSVDLEASATETGEIDAPAGTLDTLDTGPIAGFDSVTNPLDAELGSDVESDPDAKSRRNDSIANPGNATLVAIRAKLLELDDVVAVNIFENTSIIILNGRPAKSYEAVIQGGDDDEIGETMWETKPAGIRQFGSTSVVVKDSQGFDRTQFFSRPSAVTIYVEIDLTTDASFPIDGLDQVKAAVLAYGDALNISDDVIVFPQLLCSFSSVPGIIDVVIRIGVAIIPAAGSATVLAFLSEGGDLKATFAAPHGLIVGNRVTFANSGGSLPTGVTAGTVYWVKALPAADEFTFSETRTGDALPFVDGGSGTNTVSFGGRDDNIIINDDERADFDSSRITVIEL